MTPKEKSCSSQTKSSNSNRQTARGWDRYSHSYARPFSSDIFSYETIAAITVTSKKLFRQGSTTTSPRARFVLILVNRRDFCRNSPITIGILALRVLLQYLSAYSVSEQSWKQLTVNRVTLMESCTFRTPSVVIPSTLSPICHKNLTISSHHRLL
jgi:hypothetical protein